MARELEIEKKYKVNRLPENLENFEHKIIEQSYLNRGGAPIRLRKFVNGTQVKYIFSKKARVKEGSLENIEHNIELPEEIYLKLLEAKEGRTIIKTRYKIPLENGLNVELDVFHDFFEGVCIAEIEYESLEQAKSYNVPNWLGNEVTNLDKLTNGYMATQANEISDYKEFIIKFNEADKKYNFIKN